MHKLAGKPVLVTAVAPGLILGASFHNTHTTAVVGPGHHRLGIAGCADDVAWTVVFLVSECAGFISGATLDINDGIHAR